MIKVKDITDYLGDYAPLPLQAGYDNAGLIVGDPEMEVKGILVCLDSIEQTIEEAIKTGCNVVVAHHPIVFKGLKRINGANYVEKTIIKAIKNDVAIYAIHTNLDSVKHGVNAKIAEKLGVQNIQILDPVKAGLKKLVTFVPEKSLSKVREGLFSSGAGKIGDYSECSFSQTGEGTFTANLGAEPFVGKVGQPHAESELRLEVIVPNHLISGVVGRLKKDHPYEEVAYDIYDLNNENPDVGYGVVGELPAEEETLSFLNRVKVNMKAGVVRYTTIHKPSIKRVAICGGSGSFLLGAAKRRGAEVFITSDFKYHEFFDAENQIVIADIGHYESERYTSELIADYLTQKFSTFAVRISEVNTNPVNYL